MLFNNICVFTVFYNCVRFRYHHSFNLYVFTCSLNENTAHAVCTARVGFMMEQLRRSVKAAVIFYSYSIKCIIDSDIWLSHKLLPMCSTKPLTEMLTCQRLCLYCVYCYSKSLWANAGRLAGQLFCSFTKKVKIFIKTYQPLIKSH